MTDALRAPDSLLTIDEVAALWEISRSKVYVLINSGELVIVRVGAQPRIEWAELRAYVERHRQPRRHV